MKNKNKFLAVLALIFMLPVLMLFTACGGSQLDQKATCDTSGNYTEDTVVVQANALAAAIGEQTTITGNGYRLTMDMTGLDMDCEMNAIFTADGISLKYDADGSVLKLYYNQGCLYIDAAGYKYKITTNVEDFIDYVGAFSSFTSLLDPASVIAMLKSNTEIELYQDGNNYKMTFGSLTDVSVNGASVKNAVGYLNLDDEGNLVAINLALAVNAPQVSANDINLNVTMSAFNEQIEFPNFSEFKNIVDITFHL